MQTYIDSIVGYDIIMPNTKQNATSCKVMNQIGTEALAYHGTHATSAIQYTLKGLTPEIARALKSGEGYLIFEIEAIDHSIATANGNIYPMDEFGEGLKGYTFQNQLRLGGVTGRFCPYTW